MKQYNCTDEHGETDILSEWIVSYYKENRRANDYSDGNILLQSPTQITKQLHGADLNSLLRGVFALYGRFFISKNGVNNSLNDRGICDEDVIFYFILGGVQCWEDIIETVCNRDIFIKEASLIRNFRPLCVCRFIFRYCEISQA